MPELPFKPRAKPPKREGWYKARCFTDYESGQRVLDEVEIVRLTKGNRGGWEVQIMGCSVTRQPEQLLWGSKVRM